MIANSVNFTSTSAFAQEDLIRPCLKNSNMTSGVVVIPKSVYQDRLGQDFDILGFSLIKEEMAKIDTLDMRHSSIVEHNTFEFIKMLHSLKLQP